jgi:hypothetical protein
VARHECDKTISNLHAVCKNKHTIQKSARLGEVEVLCCVNWRKCIGDVVGNPGSRGSVLSCVICGSLDVGASGCATHNDIGIADLQVRVTGARSFASMFNPKTTSGTNSFYFPQISIWGRRFLNKCIKCTVNSVHYSHDFTCRHARTCAKGTRESWARCGPPSTTTT